MFFFKFFKSLNEKSQSRAVRRKSYSPKEHKLRVHMCKWQATVCMGRCHIYATLVIGTLHGKQQSWSQLFWQRTAFTAGSIMGFKHQRLSVLKMRKQITQSPGCPQLQTARSSLWCCGHMPLLQVRFPTTWHFSFLTTMRNKSEFYSLTFFVLLWLSFWKEKREVGHN